MIRWMFTAAALAASGLALAKLPAPQLDEAAQAKAAEAKAKAAWQGKVGAYELYKVQDRIAARYKTNHPAAAQPAPATQAAKPIEISLIDPCRSLIRRFYRELRIIDK